MASTFKTDNLKLSQFVATDKPAWLSDYNNDMQKIDGALDNALADFNEQAQQVMTNKATLYQATAAVVGGVLEITSAAPAGTTDYPVAFTMPAGYTPGGAVKIDGAAVAVVGLDGGELSLEAAAGAPVTLTRRGSKAFLAGGTAQPALVKRKLLWSGSAAKGATIPIANIEQYDFLIVQLTTSSGNIYVTNISRDSTGVWANSVMIGNFGSTSLSTWNADFSDAVTGLLVKSITSLQHTYSGSHGANATSGLTITAVWALAVN